MRKSLQILDSGIKFHKVIFEVILSPFFWILTLSGNTIIISFSYLFYFIEGDINSSLNSFIDALWWGFATATTVGYGDITPVTAQGKVLGVSLMLLGTALFGMYTAFFAHAIMENDFILIRKKKTNKEV